MDDQTFGQADIIGITETWVTGEVKLTLEQENDYQLYQVKAEKEVEGSRGRPSGGLILLAKKCFQVELLATHTNWILIRLINTSPETIIGVFYFRPSMKPEKCSEILEDVLDLIRGNYVNCNLIIGGDFNARLGPYQMDDEEIFDQTYVSHERSCMDQILNRRGKLFMDIMENQGLYVLNGRTENDKPGNFTMVNSQGKSSPDHCWTNVMNLPNVADFKVHNTDWCSSSDHFPIEIKVEKMNWMSLEEDIEEHDTEIEVLKWEEEKKIAYRDGITAECTTFYDEEEITVNELYERVKKLIYRVSIKNQVMKTIRWKKTQKRNNWFNRECAIKKRKLRKTLRMCKLKKYDDQVIKQLNEDRKAYREEIIKAKQEMNLNIKEKIKKHKK